MDLRILLFLFFIVISEAVAGFVEDNQNIFYGDSNVFEPAPISYQYFVNYDKLPSSDYNSFAVHSSKPNVKSRNLFKSADYADEVAYEKEVENAHRVALAKRQNNTDAAYVEAYTEALKVQRRVGLAGAKKKFNLHHRQPNQFGFNPEHSRLSVESKSHYENGGKVEYYLTDDIHDLRKSVEYIVDPDYEFNGNGVVHRQP